MDERSSPHCARCTIEASKRACMITKGKASSGCPTVLKRETLKKALAEYRHGSNFNFARQASIQEAACYIDKEKRPYVMHPVKPRVLEICEFARRMGYIRLGLIFCAGLAREAAIVAELFEDRGFQVISIVCKAGCVPKEELGLKEEDKIFMGKHESLCNPIFQAMVSNEEAVELNILLGLCVGHDSLFFRYAKAPCTVLAVKDRVTGHNPLAAIYLMGNYYGWLRQE